MVNGQLLVKIANKIFLRSVPSMCIVYTIYIEVFQIQWEWFFENLGMYKSLNKVRTRKFAYFDIMLSNQKHSCQKMNDLEPK